MRLCTGVLDLDFGFGFGKVLGDGGGGSSWSIVVQKEASICVSEVNQVGLFLLVFWEMWWQGSEDLGLGGTAVLPRSHGFQELSADVNNLVRKTHGGHISPASNTCD